MPPSNYPGALDTFTTKADGATIEEDHINDLQNAVVAVQTELGTNPSGASATVAAAIALKGNKAGETWTGTHDFTGATVTGISGGGAVSSVVGQTGAVTGTQIVADATVAAALAAKAPLASPTFTGTPAAPTAAGGTNTTQLATTAFVTAAVAAAGSGWSFQPKTGNYTALSGEFILGDATSGGFTVTLPASPASGARVGVKKTEASANVVTVAGSGGTTIDGDANATLVSRGAGAVFTFDGSNWQITAVTR